MSNINVLVNDTVRIKVKFIDVDPATGDQIEVEPLLVSVKVFDSDSVEIISTTALPVTTSQFYYDYTPTEEGVFKVRFVGTLLNGKYITVDQQLYVSTPTAEYKPTVTLREDETITFAPDIEPLYIDPEDLLSVFPDASLLEIGELIHKYSLEVKEIYAIQDDNVNPTLPFTVVEYIKAAAACDLSRTYGFGGDDELSLKLADLEITNRSMPRNVATRSNATTWCQIAASLRREILAKRVSMRGVVPKGLPSSRFRSSGRSLDPQTGKLIYLSDKELYGPGRTTPTESDDPMPDRGLRQYD